MLTRKIDECPFCGGTRHLMSMSAWCEDCDKVQPLPEWQQLANAIHDFAHAFLLSIPVIRRFVR